MRKELTTKILVAAIMLSVAGVITSNYMEKFAVDSTKLPEKVETGKEFQKWLRNHKKRFDLDADEFVLIEKNELLNSANLSIMSSENKDAYENHIAKLETFSEIRDVRFSPNEFQFLDYRRELREQDKYDINDVYYHGLREDKIFDALILSCDLEKNCYFDRAFFLDNHTFIVSEFSRPLTDEQIETGDHEVCLMEEPCEYTIKLHMFDFINNARFVYESEKYSLNLSELNQYF